MSTQDDLEKRVAELEEQMAVVESLFSERALGKERQHHERKKDDARDLVDEGDVYTKVITDMEPQSHGKPDQGVTHIETGIVTFVSPGDHNITYGDTVKIKITNVKPNTAEAIVLEVLED